MSTPTHMSEDATIDRLLAVPAAQRNTAIAELDRTTRDMLAHAAGLGSYAKTRVAQDRLIGGHIPEIAEPLEQAADLAQLAAELARPETVEARPAIAPHRLEYQE